MLIRVLIRQYKKYNRPSLNKYLNIYKSFLKIDDVITCATLGKLPQGKKHFHQNRLKNDVMESVKNKLLRRKEEINNCSKFYQIINIVEEEAESGFGELAIYDTSLRIGAFLGVYPEEVYLHAGTLKGAKAIGLQTQKKKIPLSDIPNGLKSLKVYEIEDFLCIYKNKLKNNNVIINRLSKLRVKGISSKQ